MDVVVLADTHCRRDLQLPAPVQRAVTRADIVLHAGDVTSRQALEQLRELADAHVVLGNNDRELVGLLPETTVVMICGVRVAIVHDSGPTRGRAARVHRRFPDADVVVFGHSHVPVSERGLEDQLLFNPGSPTQRRGQPVPTFGRLRLEDAAVLRHAIVAVES